LAATVIILPVVLMAIWLVLQLAMVMHVQHVAEAAAQDAALAAAAASGDPQTVAAELMARSAGSLSSDVRIATTSTAQRVTVVVHASVVQIFPFGDYSVTATASAPTEGFIPQTERP
jgi:Flp pilus assembly protein TadG